ncbi:MAG: hypothetical protein ACPGU1_04285 [Myxococcota bacterium]
MLRALRSATRTAAHYLRYHPETLVVLGRHALGRRVAVPLDLLRWAADQLPPGAGKPESLVLTARPPALAVDAVVSLMGNNRLSVGASILVEAIELGPEVFRVALRVHEVDVTALTPDSPLGKMVSAGFLDFSKPASLLSFLPKRPSVIADAAGDRFVLDLMKVPAIRRSAPLRRALATISPVLQVRELRTEGDWIVLQLHANPFGLAAALAGLRRAPSSSD